MTSKVILTALENDLFFFLFLRKIISSNQSCIAKVTVRARKSHFHLNLSRAQLSYPIYLSRRQAWPKILVSGQAKSAKFWIFGSIKIRSNASLLNFVSVKNYKNKKNIKKKVLELAKMCPKWTTLSNYQTQMLTFF